MRVCLDTNVLVAALATRGLCSDLPRAVQSEHELVIGNHILTELENTLRRKFRVRVVRPERRREAATAANARAAAASNGIGSKSASAC